MTTATAPTTIEQIGDAVADVMQAYAPPTEAETIQKYVAGGDLSHLTPDQQVALVHAVCASIGLNWMTLPLQFIVLDGEWDSVNRKRGPSTTKLYATKDCTEQLRRIYGVSLRCKAREVIDDGANGSMAVVEVEATTASGRSDFGLGATSLQTKNGPAKGQYRANLLMKTETKAKRRATMSICGLGFLDESELDGIRGHTFAPGTDDRAPTPLTEEEAIPEQAGADAVVSTDASVFGGASIFDQIKVRDSDKVEAEPWPDEGSETVAIDNLMNGWNALDGGDRDWTTVRDMVVQRAATEARPYGPTYVRECIDRVKAAAAKARAQDIGSAQV